MNWTAGEAKVDICTNGFRERDRLVTLVALRSGPETRLIPDMNYTCDGTMVGFTVALEKKPGMDSNYSIQ